MRFLLMLRSFCAVACWILLALPSKASDSNKPLTEYTHTFWNHRDGIPSAFIYSIAQTRDGYLWLATTDGLVRCDGVRFVHWRPTTGHAALLGVVRSLTTDLENTLLAGTNRGVARSENGNWRYLPMPSGIRLQNVTVVAEDRENGVWLFFQGFPSADQV